MAKDWKQQAAAVAQKSTEVDTDVLPAAKPTPADIAKAEQPEPESLPWFKVSYGDKSERVQAASKSEAWAFFCDHNRVWPSPKAGKVEAL